ncbi:MAG: FAD-dependent oxidoreductase [Acidimicrobiaceae bacterium]|nr:FAD-dependent oxidoreductase [Acidimicrobiaceae bacterium]
MGPALSARQPTGANAVRSLWSDTLGAPLVARQPLPGDLEVDVAVVGAGYTGLWTAYYLRRADPSLRVAVLERETAGFGASGRNGGWCAALFATSYGALARRYGLAAATALRRQLQEAVDEVGRVAEREGIDCHYQKGGSIDLVRGEAQRARALADVAEARAIGIGEEDLSLWGASQTAERLRATGVDGAVFTPHCAAIHPGRLVQGLAEAVERSGVTIYEGTEVTRLSPGRLDTAFGRVRSETTVVATEGYASAGAGADLAGKRRVAPVYSLMVATEPVDAETLAKVGLERRETFADHRHLVIYGQRTADGRIAFGGRGAPYHFASAVRPEFDSEPRVHAALEATLRELVPALAEVAFTHRWGGALGVPRDWHPSVGLDRSRRLAWAGGYVGDGVAASNLAGRTLAELITRSQSERTGLCWVDHRSRPWEPEPLRWVGVNAGLAVMASADHAEARTGRPARRAAWFGRLLGG